MSLEYTYDQFGAVTEIEVDQCGAGCNGTMEYEYDEAGRLTSQPGVDESLGKLEYDYEGAGLVAEFSYPVNWDYGSPGPTPSPTRFHREYVYDMADRTLDVNDGSVSGTPTPIVSYSYNKSSQLTQAEREDGSESAWDYDSTTGQLTKITHKNPQQTTISSFEYTYDDDGLRTSCTREDGDVITYGYDDQNRLVDEWRKDGENTVYRRQYEYDKVGNRMELTKNDGGTTTVYDYTYNGLGQLSMLECTSGAYHHNHYTYDKNGNLTERLEEDSENEYLWKYYWDTQDRLVKVTQQEGVTGYGPYEVYVEYKYCASCGGALNERIEYGTDGATVLSWLRYQYHGLNLLRIDERYDSDNDNVIESSDLWRVMNWYVHGPGSIGQTVRATAYSYNHNKTNSPCETNEYYYMYDALGNVNGVLQHGTYYRWEMDAFGNDLAGGNEFLPMTSEGPKEHQTGKMFDTATGLYYFQARWYDAGVGRLISSDPIAPKLDYEFVSGIPTIIVDSSGLDGYCPIPAPAEPGARCWTSVEIDSGTEKRRKTVQSKWISLYDAHVDYTEYFSELVCFWRRTKYIHEFTTPWTQLVRTRTCWDACGTLQENSRTPLTNRTYGETQDKIVGKNIETWQTGISAVLLPIGGYLSITDMCKYRIGPGLPGVPGKDWEVSPY